MVLSNVETWAEINADRLVFEPPIVDRDRFDSSSVDLLLDERLLVLPDRVDDAPFDALRDRNDVMGFLGSPWGLSPPPQRRPLHNAPKPATHRVDA